MLRNRQNLNLSKKVFEYYKRKKSGNDKSIVPNVKLNNGRRMPLLGFGTWQSAPGVAAQAVDYALDIGYRLIDCAHLYGNERELGDGLSKKIEEGAVKRAELFITSKLWNTFHSPDLVKPMCERTLKDLKTPYLDLYLIHWPMGWREGGDFFPRNKEGKLIYSDVDYVDTWKAMEKLVDHGLTKSIGISNFNSKQIERVLEAACIPPVVNQVECHPYLNQKKLLKFCKSKNIVLTAYSPLGSPGRKSGALDLEMPDTPEVMEDPVILCIAEKYDKTPAQVCIRYQITRGIVAIPKSSNKERLACNFDVFDFDLSEEDIEAIDCLNRNIRVISFPEYEFREIYESAINRIYDGFNDRPE